ncbi:UNVERIFIED_CONTAM: hypothetical protein K2H54_033139 [Gekko kuhli]
MALHQGRSSHSLPNKQLSCTRSVPQFPAPHIEEAHCYSRVLRSFPSKAVSKESGLVLMDNRTTRNPMCSAVELEMLDSPSPPCGNDMQKRHSFGGLALAPPVACLWHYSHCRLWSGRQHGSSSL